MFNNAKNRQIVLNLYEKAFSILKTPLTSSRSSEESQTHGLPLYIRQSSKAAIFQGQDKIMRYAIMVTGPAYGTQQASSALQFAHALLNEGTELVSVFFSIGKGVYNANL